MHSDPAPRSRGLFLSAWRGSDFAVIAFAVVVRIIFLLLQRAADPVLFVPIIDEQTYWADAQRWVHSGFSVAGLNLPFWQPPGYMFLLSLWIRCGGGVAGFVFVQLALGVVSSWMVYRVILRAYGDGARRWAVAAGLLYSLNPAVLYFETKLLKPTFAIFLMLAVLFLSFPRERKKTWFRRGFLCGGLILLDPYFIVWPLALAWQARRRWKALTGLALGAMSVIAAVLFLNIRATGLLAPVSYNGPINLYVGNNPNWIKKYNTLPGWPWDQITLRHDDEASASPLDVVDRSQFFVRDVKDFIRAQPLRFLKGLVAKSVLLLSALELPRDGAMIMWPPLGMLGFAIQWLMITLLFLIIPRVRQEPLLWMPLALIALVNVVFFPTSRYRLPAWPLILVATGLFTRMPAPRRRNLAAFLALLLVVAGSVFAHQVVRLPEWRAFTWNEAAWAHLDRGRFADARRCIDHALTFARLPAVLNTAGQIEMGERNNPLGALQLFDEAIQKEPGYPEPYFNQGRVETLLGREDAAYQSYEHYLERIHYLHPGFSDEDLRSSLQALEFTARVDFMRGRLRESLARLEKMREIHQMHPDSEINLNGIEQQIEQLRNRLSEDGVFGHKPDS